MNLFLGTRFYPHVPLIGNLNPDHGWDGYETILRPAMKFAHGWRNNHNLSQGKWIVLYLSSESWYVLNKWRLISSCRFYSNKIVYPLAKIVFKLKPSKDEELRAWNEEINDG